MHPSRQHQLSNTNSRSKSQSKQHKKRKPKKDDSDNEIITFKDETDNKRLNDIHSSDCDTDTDDIEQQKQLKKQKKAANSATTTGTTISNTAAEQNKNIAQTNKSVVTQPTKPVTVQPTTATKQAVKTESTKAVTQPTSSDSSSSDSDSDNETHDTTTVNSTTDNTQDIESIDNSDESEPETDTHTQSTIQPFNTNSTQANSISRAPSTISTAAQQIINTTNKSGHLIIVLINSSLETIKTKKGYELISTDTHNKLLKKLNNADQEYRPDITHQCLLALLDSPLNKAGKLTIYIQTVKNVLIQVNSKIRIPRTYKRFAGLMVQLLHKLKIRSSDGNDVLLKVIKNPITAHLPAGCLKLGTSVTGELVDIRTLAQALPTDRTTVLTVGAHATGPAKVDWTSKDIAVSQYPLSAAYALGRITNAFEYQWGIL